MIHYDECNIIIIIKHVIIVPSICMCCVCQCSQAFFPLVIVNPIIILYIESQFPSVVTNIVTMIIAPMVRVLLNLHLFGIDILYPGQQAAIN